MKNVAHITSYKDTNKNLAINDLINHATSQNNPKPPNISHNHTKLPKTSQTHPQIPEISISNFSQFIAGPHSNPHTITRFLPNSVF